MNETIKNIYMCIFIFSIVIFIYKYNILFDNKYLLFDIKYLLIFAVGISITYSLYKNSTINNNYIFSFLLFLNIGILLFLTKKYKIYNPLHLVSFIGLVYLLIIYNYKNFSLSKGELVNPDKYWIYLSIIVLLMYYLSMNSKITTLKGKVSVCLLVLYPLIFPIREYFIHRSYSMLMIVSINLLFYKTLL